MVPNQIPLTPWEEEEEEGGGRVAEHGFWPCLADGLYQVRV